MTSTPLDLSDTIRWSGLLYAFAVVGGTWFLVRTVTGALNGLGTRFSDKRLVLHQVSTIARFILFLAGISLAVALSVRLSKEVVLALTGTAAVTIGFALKDIAASILAGIVIIIDRPFQVGDRVTFAGVYGEISAIGLRSVRLVTLDDNVVTIPNNKFLTEIVASGNWGELDMLIQMDFFIGADQDVALAKRLAEEALVANRYAFTKKPWAIVVNQVIEKDYLAIRLRTKAYVLDVKYEKAFETEMTERVLEAFRAEHILPPAILHRSLAASG